MNLGAGGRLRNRNIRFANAPLRLARNHDARGFACAPDRMHCVNDRANQELMVRAKNSSTAFRLTVMPVGFA
jgi:hypothetical protein